jgi:hypothetical protein
MSRPTPPITPYGLDELSKRKNAILNKKYNVIRRRLLETNATPTFEAGKVEHSAAVNGEARTLVLQHKYVKEDYMPTTKGPRSPDFYPSTVFKVQMTYDHLVNLQPKDISALVHALGLMDLSKTQFAFSAARTVELGESTHAIHVKRDVKSAHTKSIRFEVSQFREYTCTANKNLKVCVAIDEKTYSACVRLEYKTNADKESETTTLVSECVLIFNKESRVITRLLQQYDLKKIEANTIQQLSAVITLFKEMSEGSTHAKLADYIGKRFSTTKFVARDPSDRLRADSYIQYFQAQLRDIQTMHLTYAYLRAIVAVLAREIMELGTINQAKKSTDLVTFDDIVNTIQKHTEDTKKTEPTEAYIIYTANLVSSLVKELRTSGVVPADLATTMPNFLKDIQGKMVAQGIDTSNLDLNTDFGAYLTIYLLEKLNPVDIIHNGLTISWLEDDRRETISGTSWTVSFNVKLHTNHLHDPRPIFDGAKLVPWLKHYNLFKEEKGSNDRLCKHMFRVRHTVKEKYRFTVHHPYTDLYEAKDHRHGQRITG